MVLTPLTLVLGTFMLRSHLSRHLPEALNTSTQLQRWRDATEVIIGMGQLRRLGQYPTATKTEPSRRNTLRPNDVRVVEQDRRGPRLAYAFGMRFAARIDNDNHLQLSFR